MPHDLSPVGWAVAFLAGIVSFVSPCVLPLIPGYISYVSGVSLDDLEGGPFRYAAQVAGQSMLFVGGFAVVFTALGASASAIGSALADYRPLLNQLSGLFIIVMGLSLIGVLRIGALLREHRLHVQRGSRGPLGVLALGGAFAFAWIPCVGPILASILLYAGTATTVRTGAALLFVYALGLGVPFIATGLAFARAVRALRWLRRYSGRIEAVSGLALVAVGFLVLTNKMFYVAIWGQEMFIRLGLNVWQSF